jgi:predicted membrane channel-forming protein YqfA (hemolysin III family)
MVEDNFLIGTIKAERERKNKHKKLWKVLDYFWCGLLLNATFDTITNHTFAGLSALAALTGLIIARIVIGGVRMTADLLWGVLWCTLRFTPALAACRSGQAGPACSAS